MTGELITSIEQLTAESIGTGDFYINCDCMDGMKKLPDRSVDLAIVDPVYGGVTQGGYMKGLAHGDKKPKVYNLSLWQQCKTPPEYFKELFRVCKNAIIWGGELLH